MTSYWSLAWCFVGFPLQAWLEALGCRIFVQIKPVLAGYYPRKVVCPPPTSKGTPNEIQRELILPGFAVTPQKTMDG